MVKEKKTTLTGILLPFSIQKTAREHHPIITNRKTTLLSKSCFLEAFREMISQLYARYITNYKVLQGPHWSLGLDTKVPGAGAGKMKPMASGCMCVGRPACNSGEPVEVNSVCQLGCTRAPRGLVKHHVGVSVKCFKR